MEHAHYEEAAGKLRGLLIRLDDRLSANDLSLVTEFINANELGVALEWMADSLSKDKQPLSVDERATYWRWSRVCRWASESPGRLRFSDPLTPPDSRLERP